VLHHAAEELQHLGQLEHGVQVVGHGLHAALAVVVRVVQVVAKRSTRLTRVSGAVSVTAAGARHLH